MYYASIVGLILIGTFIIQAAVQDEVLNYHNQYRRLHGARPLKLNKRLSDEAQKYAESLARRGGKLQHSRGRYGENLSASMGYSNPAKVAVDGWYKEKRYYNPANPRFTEAAGHFTQLVWKDTRELGVGIATFRGKTYVVCRYFPPGNVNGQFRRNVQKQ